MSYSNIIRKIITFCVCICFTTVIGQTACDDLLKSANGAYRSGKYEQVISLLSNSLDSCKFSKVEREQATKLIVSAQSSLDEIEEAEKYVYRFLKKNPTYTVQATVDPKPFVSIINKFDRLPRWVVGFYVGEYFPIIKTQKTYMVWGAADYTSEYKTQSNLSFSLNFQYFLSRKLCIGLEPEFTKSKFSREMNIVDIENINYIEESSLFKLPVSLAYQVFKRNNFSASLSAGVYGISTSNSHYKISYHLPNSEVVESYGNLGDQRREYNYGYLGGVNFVYVKNKLRFSATAKYSFDFHLHNNAEQRYSADNLAQDYYYIDDDFKVNHVDIKLGIAYAFSYKIKHKYRSK